MKTEELGTSKPTVSELFVDKQYKIPKYQRAYSWNKEKAEQMFMDVFESGADDYFLGSILLNKIDNCFEVIDGQQRLTTISLFLLALHLVYKVNVNESDSLKYIHKFLKFGDIKGEYNTLILSRHNQSFYSYLINIRNVEEINNIVATNSNKNILDVVKFFVEKINEKKQTDVHLEKQRLSDLLERVTKKVFFLQLTVSGYAQASKLFEVLNNRGTELSEADLVRNYLLSELERQGLNDEENINKWESIEDNISLRNLERFLRYSTFLFSSESDIYGRIKQFTTEKSSKTAIDTLSNLSKFYLNFEDPELFEDSLESSLHSELNIIGATQVRSVMLAAYSKFSNEQILELLKFLVSFSLRYVISDKNPNKLEKKYADISFKIYSEGMNLSEVIEELKKRETFPSDEEFELSFLNRSFKTSSLPRYILSKIENFISTEEKDVNLLAVDLEHIMPKKIDKWQTVKDYEEVHKNYLNNIGNMVILSSKINSRIKNDLFSNKKNHYDDSEINLITEIKTKIDWSELEIVWNAKRYFEQANKIWNV